jgi:hypothetical protein
LNPIDLEFRYHKLSAEEKARLLDFLRKRLEGIDDIIFAYVHGGFLERSFFRDVDVAFWISDLEKAFYYTALSNNPWWTMAGGWGMVSPSRPRYPPST